jgi:quinol monooxygenase YgiN
MTEAITVVAKLRAAPNKGDQLAVLLREQTNAVRSKEPECTMYRVHRSTKDPELFILYETYANDAAFDAHRQSPHLAEYRQRREREGLVAGPAEVELYRAITD